MDKKKTCCFTGHRIIPDADRPALASTLRGCVQGLIEDGFVYFLSGGALGFDQMAAAAVLEARERHPAVKLMMALPCRDQDAPWREADRLAYRALLERADHIVCLAERYYNGCMAQRNLYLAERSSLCVAYLRHGRSGTSQCVRLAKEHGADVVNLAEPSPFDNSFL